MFKNLIISLRPKQWTKNSLLFAGLVFSQNLFQASLAIRVLLGFVIFCLLSGATYMINDLLDLQQDRIHPVKSKRPIASGRLPKSVVLVVSIGLILIGLFSAFFLDRVFGFIALSYICLTLCYSFFLKHVVILDMIVVSLGFVLRAVAGAEIIHVKISSWLLVCTIFLALFLSLGKRRHELILLGDNAQTHRPILEEYSPYLLDQMISVVTASTVMAYTLYTTSPETVEKFGTRNLVFTTPFVLFGIFRYLYLMHQKRLGGSPEQILLSDKPMIFNIFLYLITAGIILYLH
jgi:4-hydroxybenzoate polyprenyltransferase